MDRTPTSFRATARSIIRSTALVAKVWGIPPEELPGPGKSAYEMLDAMGSEGGIRALWLVASNIAVSTPRGSCSGAYGRAGLPDGVGTFSLQIGAAGGSGSADNPVGQEEGTMTNLEGRVVAHYTVFRYALCDQFRRNAFFCVKSSRH